MRSALLNFRIAIRLFSFSPRRDLCLLFGTSAALVGFKAQRNLSRVVPISYNSREARTYNV